MKLLFIFGPYDGKRIEVANPNPTYSMHYATEATPNGRVNYVLDRIMFEKGGIYFYRMEGCSSGEAIQRLFEIYPHYNEDAWVNQKPVKQVEMACSEMLAALNLRCPVCDDGFCTIICTCGQNDERIEIARKNLAEAINEWEGK